MKRRRAKWSEAEVISKIKEWVERYGEIPAATDWNPGDCRRSARISTARAQRWTERSLRFGEGTYPYPKTVQDLFGSWNAAIIAAGFQPRTTAIVLDDKTDPNDAIQTLQAKVGDLAHLRKKEYKITTLHEIASLALTAAEALDE